MPLTTTNVLLVEDHAILRAGLRAILAEENGFAVVGEAADGREGILCADRLQPDLALMDISMPKMNGTEAIRQIKKRLPRTKVLILTPLGGIGGGLRWLPHSLQNSVQTVTQSVTQSAEKPSGET